MAGAVHRRRLHRAANVHVVGQQSRSARVADIRRIAMGMPFVTEETGPKGNPIYQVGRKSFVFFRNPRPDAVDPETGDPYPDVIVLWTASESDKQALLQDDNLPLFTTAQAMDECLPYYVELFHTMEQAHKSKALPSTDALSQV